MKRRMALLLALMLALLMAAVAHADEAITSIEQLNAPGMRVGVATGSATMLIAERELPNAELVYYDSGATAYETVAQGKLDAYVYDRLQMELAILEGRKGVHLLDENLDETIRVAAGISPVSKIPDLEAKLNSFIAEMKANGTLDDMYDRWAVRRDETMPDIEPAENPQYALTVGTSGTVPPFSYYVGTELSGYDVELARRFAAWLGASLSFKVYDYGAIIPACATGDVDCVMANLNITPERAEELTFSDDLYEAKLGVMVRGDAPEAAPAASAGEGEYASPEELVGKRIGVQTGTISGEAAQAGIGDVELSFFNSQTDCMAALRAGKVDAWCIDEPVARYLLIENTDLVMLGDTLDHTSLAAVFARTDAGQALRDEYSAFVDGLWADGTMAEIDAVWFGTDDDKRTVLDYENLPDTNGTLRMAVDTSLIPFAMVKDNRVVGYDVDIAARFCQANGYRLEVVPMSFDGVLPSVQSGKCDFAACCITITEERAESVLFSSENYKSGNALVVRRKGGGPAQASAITSLDQMNGKRVGVQTGSTFDQIVLDALPDAQINYFNSYPDMAAALEANKIDGFPGDEPVLQLMAAENDKLAILDGRMDSFEFGFVLPKTDAGDKLLAEINAWLADIKASGELDEVVSKWTSGQEADKTLPDYSAYPAPNGTLRMATEGAYAPMNYYRGDEIVGFEIDLAARFCEANGYGLVVEAMNFDGILPAVQAGKADFAAAGITITEERAQSVNFSTPYYTGGTVMAVLKGQTAKAAAASAYTTLDQLNGARIGVQTGTVYNEIVLARLPDAKISFFNTYPDLAAAMEANKIDGFPGDEPVLRLMAAEDDQLAVMDDYMESFDFGFVIAKTPEGEALTEEANAWLAQVRENGELEALLTKWIDGPQSEKVMPDYAAYPATKGTLRFATEGAYAPMNYFRGEELVGFEVELAARFCEANGYGFSPEAMNFDGILPAVQSGKVDFGAACITITDERRESVNFSDAYYTCRTAMAVLKGQGPATAVVEEAEDTSFLGGIRSSFNKTFLREDRWRLFAQGILTTLLITVLSILFGTLLGFVVFMLCRNGNPAANAVTRFCVWLVQGMPMVVLLMILYYIIFGSVAISGVFVAVIGFTLTFGSAVYGLLRMGVGAVDGGQYEAAYALGYSNRRTFFRIILPQALPHVLPAYRGEIVSLIKATSIVGYIAVQDLTKMGDIVRSRTYEAFFPLIAVSIIYFALEGLIGFLVSRISVNFNPKRRKPSEVLKGVRTDDQN